MAEHFNVVEQFGIDVFNEETMKQRLPKNVFKALKKTIAEGKELDSSIADVVAPTSCAGGVSGNPAFAGLFLLPLPVLSASLFQFPSSTFPA